MDDVLAYKPGASFFSIGGKDESNNPKWEDNVTPGQGWSYGTEILIQKKSGKLSGWIGYTLSWTQLQFDEINFGKKYYAKYDRRHDISVVAIYKLNEKITISSTWVYGTGNAITLPLAEYEAISHNPGNNNPSYYYVSDYGNINDFRMAAYHRMDIGIQFHKKLKWAYRTFELSIYNVYNRKNPFYYYIDGNELKQISLFPIIPSISYNLKF